MIQKPPTAEPHQLHVFHHLLKVVTARLQLLYLGGRCHFWWRISQNFLADAAEASRFGAQNVIPNIGGREIPRSKRARSSASHRDSRDREPGVKRQ